MARGPGARTRIRASVFTAVPAGLARVDTDSVTDRRDPLCLVLWDIDHTLIETRGLGRDLYGRAFERATGRHMERAADVTGQTEPAILSATLKLHGLDDDEQVQASYARALADEYQEHAADLRRRGQVLPGAREALIALSQQPNIVQSVLSGNLRAVSIIKLTTFDLDRYVDLDSGAYGGDDHHRPNLVAVAQGRASGRHGCPFTRTNTVLIGDSTHDVRTGVEGGSAVIGVASGSDSEEALHEAGADAVLPDLGDVERLIRALRSATGS